MKKYNEDIAQSFVKVAKRISITIICTIPLLIVVGYLTRNVIKSNALQIFMFMVIMGVMVLIVELVARRREKRKKVIIENTRDVFK